MNALVGQIGRVRRRLTLRRWLVAFAGCLTATLILAAAALGVSKFVDVGVDPTLWTVWWCGGAVVAAITISAAWAFFGRPSALGAAIEIDRRFDLRERVSSAMTLSPADREGPAGRAVLADAQEHLARIDVAERFSLASGRRLWWPLAPAAVAIVLAWIPSAMSAVPQDDDSAEKSAQQQIVKATDDLRKNITERRRLAEELELAETADLLRRVEERLQQVKKQEPADAKQSLVKLNDLAKQIEQRRQSLADKGDLARPLDQLKKVERGPADAFAQALKNNDPRTAKEEIDRLRKKLQDEKLDPREREQLAKQLEDMRRQLERLTKSQQDAQRDLESQLAEARRSGDSARAQDLEDQLDRLKRRSEAMEKLAELAQKMGQCAGCLNADQMADALRRLEELGGQLEELDLSKIERELLTATEEQIERAKAALAAIGKEGGKDGKDGDGLGPGESKDDKSMLIGRGQGSGDRIGLPGHGLGEGKGAGERPKTANDTKAIDEQVPAKVGRGRSVVVGETAGPNIRGKVSEIVDAPAFVGEGRNEDALGGERLPKAQREHAQEFFDRLRKPSP